MPSRWRKKRSALMEGRPDGDELEVFNVLADLANALSGQRRFAEAEVFARRALLIIENKNQAGTPRLVYILTMVGIFESRAGTIRPSEGVL